MNNKRSIIIFGKGPSVLNCTRDIVKEYDEIAICNFPVLNDFFCKLIEGKKINHHFANCGTYDDRYTTLINKKLGITNIYNTNSPGTTNYLQYIAVHTDKNSINFHNTLKEDAEKYFKNLPSDSGMNKLDPSTGTMALWYLVNTKMYDNVCLVGFDNFIKGDSTYYYKPSEYNNKIKYLINNALHENEYIITKDGTFNIESGHSPSLTMKFYNYIFKNNKNIKFKIISNNKNYCTLDNVILV